MQSQSVRISRLTNGIYRCTQRYLDRTFARYGLSSGTYPILLSLDLHAGASQNRMADEIGVDKAMVARSVRKLVDLGYVDRRADADDSRAVKLSLSAKGRSVVPVLRAELARWNDLIAEGLSEDELSVVREGLSRIFENARKYRSRMVPEGETD